MKLKLLCNWCLSKELHAMWSHMIPSDSPFILTSSSSDADVFVIINKQKQDESYVPSKTIVIQMEPHMNLHPEIWGKDWANPNPKFFKKVFTHQTDPNTIEWHLSFSYDFLSSRRLPVFLPRLDAVSAVLSAKYHDPGHKYRVDLARRCDQMVVYGHQLGYKNFDSTYLPPRQKENALIPYKYHLAVENHQYDNYVTEKLFDGILCECLVFYHGAPNVISAYDLPEGCLVKLSGDIDEDLKTIEACINSDEYTKRLPLVKEAKKIILSKSLFHRLSSVFKNDTHKINELSDR